MTRWSHGAVKIAKKKGEVSHYLHEEPSNVPQDDWIDLQHLALSPKEPQASADRNKGKITADLTEDRQVDLSESEKRKLARLRVKEKRKEKITPFWQSLSENGKRKEKTFLISIYHELIGDEICRATAKNRLEINCDYDTAEDLKSNEAERQQRALHKLDFCMTDDLLNNEEKSRIHEIIMNRCNQTEEGAWSVYYQGRKRIPAHDKIIYRKTVHKSDKLLTSIADDIYKGYLQYHAEVDKTRKRDVKDRLIRLQ